MNFALVIRCTNRKHKLCLRYLTLSLGCLGRLHWIEKRSSHGRLLEHLVSSGTKIMMSGPEFHGG